MIYTAARQPQCSRGIVPSSNLVRSRARPAGLSRPLRLAGPAGPLTEPYSGMLPALAALAR